MRQGTFIAIEGIDKLANVSQVELLLERLKKAGYDTEFLDFSKIQEPAGHFINQYLEGKFGSAQDVGPYASSLFYAMNRFHAAVNINRSLAEGKVVIASNYTGGSMAEQGSIFSNPEERRGFFIWLDNLDFQMLRLPRPDKTIVLRMPVEGLNGQFKNLASTYDDLCQLFPKDYLRLDYVRSGKSMDSAQIHGFVWKFMEPLLPKTKPQNKAVFTPVQPSSVYIPTVLDRSTREKYVEGLSSMLELRRQIGGLLSKMPEVSSAKKLEVLESLLPLAAYTSPSEQSLAQKLTDGSDDLSSNQSLLNETYASQAKTVSLILASPRNEMNILTNLLYSQTSLPKQQVNEQITKWSYEEKIKVFNSYFTTDTKRNQALKELAYELEIVAPTYVLRQIKSIAGVKVLEQPASPRYGFDVPDFIEGEDKLLELYEATFKQSLELYSLLQQAGYESCAQLAVLRGHKLRAGMWLNGDALFQLFSMLKNSEINTAMSTLLMETRQKIDETHPLATAYLPTVK